MAEPPRMEIQTWNIGRFIPYDRNPPKNDATVDRMCAKHPGIRLSTGGTKSLALPGPADLSKVLAHGAFRERADSHRSRKLAVVTPLEQMRIKLKGKPRPTH